MLVNCVAYQDGRKVADIQKREIRSYLARPDCFVWVALRDADAAELAEMQDEFDLHALAVEDAAHGNQRPKEREHHTIPPPEPDQYPEAVEFAGALARRLDDGRQQGEFERLLLVASPDFLGTLRKKLSRPTAKLVDRSLDANLTHLDADDIRKHLPEII